MSLDLAPNKHYDLVVHSLTQVTGVLHVLLFKFLPQMWSARRKELM